MTCLTWERLMTTDTGQQRGAYVLADIVPNRAPSQQSGPHSLSARPATPWPADYASPGTRRVPAADSGPGIAMIAFGVALPLAVILIECLTRMCASAFFDPLPTPWHLAFALAVP